MCHFNEFFSSRANWVATIFGKVFAVCCLHYLTCGLFVLQSLWEKTARVLNPPTLPTQKKLYHKA